VSTTSVENRILEIRGQKVILDRDLAEVYGATTKRLNEQVRRNRDRFPADFAFRLTREETGELVAKCDRFSNLKHSSVLPYAFTEYGALMAANVLKSERAIEMSLFVIRAFVRMREVLASRGELAKRLEGIERKLLRHDVALQDIYKEIKALKGLAQTKPPAKIGFRPDAGTK
jgi:hypothetical protein